jgi:glutathione synthase/RimK-type ligase-like ATP-grasp enzyme
MTSDQIHIEVVTAAPYKLNDEERELVLRASRASKAYMVGVDHIIFTKVNHMCWK